jgi:phospholipid/cholesterol/gamma-HCH transport system permease protein
MQAGDASFLIRPEGDRLVVEAAGSWLVASAAALDRALRRLDETAAAAASVSIDLAAVDRLDTAGAWLVLRTQNALVERGVAADLKNVPDAFAPLIEQVAKGLHDGATKTSSASIPAWQALLQRLGERAVGFGLDAGELCGFFGLVVMATMRSLRHPSRIRWLSVVAQVQRTGVTALPIIGLLSFLIGVVIAYQGADQLRQFGAEIFTVNLLGIGILRELGVLMTSIVVAGRSGSAFTAEIGAMEVNEEIDAMRTLGLDPVEVLVLPRVLGLLIALPLLTIFADFAALVGGALMSLSSLDILPILFVRQLHDAIGVSTFGVGVLKAFFFAPTIAIVGCQAGVNVARSAESVGRQTTLSVVRSIFLVIVIDAAFSVIFSRLGI